MANAYFGYQNALVGGTTADSTGTYAGFPSSNLAVEQGGNSYSWRFAATAKQTQFNSFTLQNINVVSLHRMNLTASAIVQLQLLRNHVVIWDSGALTGIPAHQQIVALVGTVSADQLVIFVTDAGQPFVSIGFAYCGPIFQPSRQWTFDNSKRGRTKQVDGFTSRSGVQFPQFRYQQRTASLAWSSISPADAITMDLIGRYTNEQHNLLVIPQPDMLVTGIPAVFGIATIGDFTFPQTGPYRGTSVDISERL